MSWHTVLETDQEYAKLTKRFKDFRTVDWVAESCKENRNYYSELNRWNRAGIEATAPFLDDASINTVDSLSSSGLLDDLDRVQSTPHPPTTADSHDSVQSRLSQHLATLRRGISRIRVVKSRLWITFQSWLALTLIGALVGAIAGSLNIFTEWLGDLKEGHCSDAFYLNKDFCCWGEDQGTCSQWVPWSTFAPLKYIVYIAFSVLFGTTAALLCKHYAPSAAGSGISEVKCIVSGFVTDGFLGWWTLFIKSIGLPLVIASGLNVGKEGPSVHYAACAGNVIPKLFHNFKRSYIHQSQFLTAAAAAGVAVAFAAPIGGVLFSIEEISSVFRLSTMWMSYYCALVATGTLSAMNTFRTGQIVIFQVTYDSGWHYYEVPVFVLLGIFGGLYGIFVAKYNIKVIAFRNKYLKSSPVKEVAILCFLTAAIGYFSKYIRMDMTESIEVLFHECREASDVIGGTLEGQLCKAATGSGSQLLETVVSLFYATLLRIVFVIISYNSKIPCGIFVPSMAAGASFGKAIGLIMEWMLNDRSKCALNNGQCIISGTYAFLGAAAALCGITNLTLAVVIIMFELTGALKYVIPTMIVVATTKIVGDTFGLGLGGVADQMVRFNGIPFLDAKEEHEYGDLKLSDAMVKDVVVLPFSGMHFADLQTLLEKTKLGVFPVVDLQSRATLGVADRKSLVRACRRYRRLVIDNGSTGSTGSVVNPPRDPGELTDLDFTQRPVRFVSEENVVKMTGKRLGYDSEEEYNDNPEVDFTGCLMPELFCVDIATSLYTVLDTFVRVGPRVLVVEDRGKLAGVITRKDLAKFDVYLHYQEHGDVFVTSGDEAVFRRLWAVLQWVDARWQGTLAAIKHYRSLTITQDES